MKAISIALAITTLVTGLKAAWHWYQSSRVIIDPGWTPPGLPGPSEPVMPEQQQTGWTVATITAFEEAASLNRTASLWTAASVGLSAASAVIGALALN